ncbi:MAG: magnesium transporter [Planctomycetaceae bacterium]
MVDNSYNSLILPDLKQMLRDDDKQGLSEFCTVLHAAVCAAVLDELKKHQVWQVLDNCDLARRVEIFEFLDLHRQEELVQVLDRDRLSSLLEEMAPDDRVDLLERLPTERVDTLLPLIAQAERNDIRKLLSCEEDTAGAIMTTDYASLPEDITAREALEKLRQQAPDSETIYYIYILNPARRLDGFVSLRDIIMAQPDKPLADIMKHDVISVYVDDDQEQVAQTLARYDFIAMPVVDHSQRLVGIITHDDILDVVREEATEDAYRLGAVEPMEDSYLDTPVRTIGWKRGVWLLFLALVALVTADVLGHYESIAEGPEFRFLVLFLPLVLASGGNAGSQSATLIIRTLALGELERDDYGKMARRELLIGFMLGGTIATVAALAAVFWFNLGWTKAAVVSTTVLLVVVLGSVVGSLLPLVLRRLRLDPAIMSNPLIAAIIDVLGVVLYYRVALMAL